MESEEALMGSLINGMQGAQGNLQTQVASTPAPQESNVSTGALDIMA